MTASYESTSRQIQDAFMKLFAENELHKITVKRLCLEIGMTRTSFYNYYSDIYDVLESIEDLLVSDLKNLNRSFFTYDFHHCTKQKFVYFYDTLIYIQEHAFWFKTLLNKSRDGQFIYKWKKIIKEDFSKKFFAEKIFLENEEVVLEMISSGCIGAYTYWVNNLNKVNMEIVAREVLYRLCSDFF